jgi:hypothetical protein
MPATVAAERADDCNGVEACRDEYGDECGVIAAAMSHNSDSDKFIVLRGRRIVKKKKRKCVTCE